MESNEKMNSDSKCGPINCYRCTTHASSTAGTWLGWYKTGMDGMAGTTESWYAVTLLSPRLAVTALSWRMLPQPPVAFLVQHWLCNAHAIMFMLIDREGCDQILAATILFGPAMSWKAWPY